MALVIDIETRSKVDLKKSGAYRYAEDCELLCMGYMDTDTGELRAYVPPAISEEVGVSGDEFPDTAGQILVAHNAGFERCVLDMVAPEIPNDPRHWSCTAARALAVGLPGDLKRCAEILGLTEQKDTGGYALMLKYCKPRPRGGWWHDSVDFTRLVEYCKQDVATTAELHAALPELTYFERELWALDQIINPTGVPIDMVSVAAIMKKLASYAALTDVKLAELTKGRVRSARQVASMLQWLREQGCYMADLTSETVADKLRSPDTPPPARKALELRQSSSKSSTAKYQTLKRAVCKDGRIRGLFQYHKASTGRWASTLVQVHNLPRPRRPEDAPAKPEELLFALTEMDIDSVPGCPMSAASDVLRMVLHNPKGMTCVDFSAIEARVNAWLAGEDHVLEAFRTGRDLYKVAAEKIFKVEYDDVTSQQRLVGKVAVLALGYQGWTGAFAAMSGTYGLSMTESEASEICAEWRTAHPAIVRSWHMYEEGFKGALLGKPRRFRHIGFRLREGSVLMQLPSGREVWYRDAQVDDDGTISYMGLRQNKWQRVETYGGKLCENACQAVARDLLAHALLHAHKEGMHVFLHVHDEIVVEGYHLKRLTEIMSDPPEWADDLPLAAEGWEGVRYRK